MGDAFRPADRVTSGRWTHRDAEFDLAGLDLALRIAVLRQWAEAPALRAEIVGMSASLQGFVRKYGGSINHLRNMLNGHRLTDHTTYVLVTSNIRPERLPDEQSVRSSMRAAFARSDAPAAPAVPALGNRYVTGADADATTGPSDPDAVSTMPQPHPDAALIRALFTHAVLGDPVTLQYLASDRLVHPEDPQELTVDVEVVVAAGDDAIGAEGYIAGSTITGTIWAPANWKHAAYAACGATVGGAFVLEAREGNHFRAIDVFVEAGDSPEVWDVAFRGASCTLDAGGLTWDAPSQDLDTGKMPIDGQEWEADE